MHCRRILQRQGWKPGFWGRLVRKFYSVRVISAVFRENLSENFTRVVKNGAMEPWIGQVFNKNNYKIQYIKNKLGYMA